MIADQELLKFNELGQWSLTKSDEIKQIKAKYAEPKEESLDVKANKIKQDYRNKIAANDPAKKNTSFAQKMSNKNK